MLREPASKESRSLFVTLSRAVVFRIGFALYELVLFVLSLMHAQSWRATAILIESGVTMRNQCFCPAVSGGEDY